MLSVRCSGSDQWPELFHFDANCRVDFKAEASAISGYSESYPDLLNLQPQSSSSSSSIAWTLT